MSLQLDTRHVASFLPANALEQIWPQTLRSYKTLLQGTGPGNDFLGWVHLPSRTDAGLLQRLDATAQRIRDKATLFVVIGIGGSYLGARAVIEALGPAFPGLPSTGQGPGILYAGENLSQDYHASLLELLDQHDYAVAVISKSGTTTEPAVAFRLIRSHLEEKYGKKGARERIIAITDGSKGALKRMADIEGYETYMIPDDVGGRYSVLTPVGLLPVAVSGLDIHQLIAGAAGMEDRLCASPAFEDNPATRYAAVRNLLAGHGKAIELLVSYEPGLILFTEWWKQLYGESEGKNGKGIFPAGVNFTTDLHSMGQFIQDGTRNLFETVLSVENPQKHLIIPVDPENHDGLNFLSGKSLHEVNQQAERGTRLAHLDGGVPQIRISIPELSEKNLGGLIYFFEFACGISGYLLGVNPFDQPGVEAYKRNMFALLGKPGYEKETEAIRKRI